MASFPGDGSATEEPLQLSLLQGFPAGRPQSPGGPALAPVLPVARVLIESSLPHLDRPFDYSVPASLDDAAQPGVRVKVKFNGQELSGFILDRLAESDAGHTLVPLHKVVSPVQVLTPELAELAGRVAARYAGTLSDVLRVAIPPRVAKLEKELAAEGTLSAGAAKAARAPQRGERGAGRRPRSATAGPGPATSTVRRSSSILGPASRRVRSSARSRASAPPAGPRSLPKPWRPSAPRAAAPWWWFRITATWTAWRRPWPPCCPGRTLPGSPPTTARRPATAATFASSPALPGLPSAPARQRTPPCTTWAWWCAGTTATTSISSSGRPYAHTREVLLLRAEQEGAACLLAAHTRSTELQRLVDAGWARAVEADRPEVRRTVPRVLNTADSFEQERDPLARIARLPGAAWRAAKEGLERGPVLVQVARSGYAPSLVCDSCREPARCTACSGPLAVAGAAGSSAVPQCRWCSAPAPAWRCSHCTSPRLRRSATGVLRTAEELGRAFPGKPVITSSGDHVKATVPDTKALVVATVGAEPVAAGGYAAALLLDGDSLLRRENLRAGEDAVRRWFNAAALVKPARDGGLVVITADDTAGVGALLRWDAGGYARRELSLRQELHLPPAVRIASVTGGRTAVGHFTEAIEKQLARQDISLRTAGPAPLLLSDARPGQREAGEDVRTLLFIPYARAAEATRVMRAVKAAAAARRSDDPVQLRLDGVDVL